MSIFYTGKIAIDHIPIDVIDKKNNSKSWQYGYDKEYDVVVISRTGQIDDLIYQVEGLTIALPKRPKEKDIVNYAELTSKIISNSLLIINASPLGMFPKINNCPEIDYTLLTQKHILFDLIYNPEQTLFLKKGQEHGTKTINGMKMLILQAEKTWEIFNR